MLLDGKKAIVTGASRGIGRAIALALARAGADVVVNFNGQAAAAGEVAARIREMGRQAVTCGADVSIPSEAAKLVKVAVEQLGGLHILVNNAGI
ncbi:MAG: SDR family NAD(P)-dependent oxidoreductase [Desulfofundulus sp.]